MVENLSDPDVDGESTVDILALETFVGRHPRNKNVYNLLPSKFSQFKLMAKVVTFLFRFLKSYDVIHIRRLGLTTIFIGTSIFVFKS